VALWMVMGSMVHLVAPLTLAGVFVDLALFESNSIAPCVLVFIPCFLSPVSVGIWDLLPGIKRILIATVPEEVAPGSGVGVVKYALVLGCDRSRLKIQGERTSKECLR
jgi:hypothetical protein